MGGFCSVISDMCKMLCKIVHKMVHKMKFFNIITSQGNTCQADLTFSANTAERILAVMSSGLQNILEKDTIRAEHDITLAGWLTVNNEKISV